MLTVKVFYPKPDLPFKQNGVSGGLKDIDTEVVSRKKKKKKRYKVTVIGSELLAM